jgi:hypothetical protein
LSRAILIGTSVFTGLPNLPAVRNNLTDLADALTNPATGILPRDRCTVVSTPDSTATFMRNLREAARQAEDFLLVYYAGHGVRDQIHNDRLYLAVRETDPDGPDGTAVPFESVRDVIQQSMARTRVLLLDCCYSGLAVGAMSAMAVDAHEVAVRGTAVITSSPSNKRSLSPEGDRHTAFTGELITLLQRGSRVDGEQLTVGSAFRSLRNVLVQRHLPEPKMKLTDTGSDILLRRSPPAPTPRPLSRPAQTPRAIRQPVQISPEQRTVPVLTPVAAPSPAAELPRVPARPGIVKTAMKDLGWFALWFCVAVGVALLVGGFGTEIATGQGGSTGIVGIVFTVMCGIPAAMRMQYLRKHVRSSPRLGELSPLLAKARVPLSILGLAVFAISALTATVSTTAGTSTVVYSTVTNVTMTTLVIEGAVACAYKLYRSIVRQRGQGTSTALP